MIPPGIEPGTLSVLDSRDNHYTMESIVTLSDIIIMADPYYSYNSSGLHLGSLKHDSTRDRTGDLECVRLT